jgi:uncharacterized protein DUF4439
MSRRTTVRALQSALAAEHAVVYGYGVVGAHLSGASRRRAQADYDAHRTSRDELESLLRARRAAPVAASASYALPRPVTTARDAVVLATLLEERLAAVWADAVVDMSRDLRPLAIGGVRDAAVRAAQWRGGSVPFPGLPERAE